MPSYYADHAQQLKRDLAREIPVEALRELHQKRPLLHEVVHRAVLREASEGGYRFLGLLYAVPSGISSSQFTRWHLDHHAGLGSDEEDPKRHYLSPKINARWLKFLYFTPALFPIYFRAAARETASYEPALRKQIA